MSAANRLVRTMQRASRKGDPLNLYTDVVFGVVTSANPLKIKVGDRIEVSEDFLMLSPFCKKVTFEIEDKKMMLWNDLQVNDKVTMLRVKRGQGYIVLYRDFIEVKEVEE